MNELILMPIDTSCPQDRGLNWSLWGGVRSSKVKVIQGRRYLLDPFVSSALSSFVQKFWFSCRVLIDLLLSWLVALSNWLVSECN